MHQPADCLTDVNADDPARAHKNVLQWYDFTPTCSEAQLPPGWDYYAVFDSAYGLLIGSFYLDKNSRPEAPVYVPRIETPAGRIDAVKFDCRKVAFLRFPTDDAQK